MNSDGRRALVTSTTIYKVLPHKVVAHAILVLELKLLSAPSLKFKLYGSFSKFYKCEYWLWVRDVWEHGNIHFCGKMHSWQVVLTILAKNRLYRKLSLKLLDISNNGLALSIFEIESNNNINRQAQGDNFGCFQQLP